MSEIIYFYTELAIDKDKLETFLNRTIGFSSFVWITDFYDYLLSHTMKDDHIYIVTDVAASGYKYSYEVYINTYQVTNLRAMINILKSLAITLDMSILASDDEIAPFTYVLIEPTGETSTIALETGNELVIKEPYNVPLGDFRTRERLTENELQQLRELADVYPDIVIEYSKDEPVINGPFNEVKEGIEQLKQFDHHYELRPGGKNTWRTRDEKAHLFKELMKNFGNVIQKDLSVFTR